MTDEYLPQVTLTIEANGTADVWEFELGPEAPIADAELRDALMKEFAPNEEPELFELVRRGTAARPYFTLRQKRPAAFLNPRPGKRS
ncbi:hypothetical protein EV649_5018 [Kribbella sp. VKM Ac-2569]|nr:hypothetical protein EV649_5018 [Kribbella sp. VKM Ac-2569]